MAKIARIDYPKLWYASVPYGSSLITDYHILPRPNLPTDILTIIQASYQARYENYDADPKHGLVLRRTLTTLNQILKELTAAKVPGIALSVSNVNLKNFIGGFF